MGHLIRCSLCLLQKLHITQLTLISQAQRSSEITLAPSFASLQLKKFELEFSVDPLFKKASADFDE